MEFYTFKVGLPGKSMSMANSCLHSLQVSKAFAKMLLEPEGNSIS